MVDAVRKVSGSEKKKIHIVMGSAIFTCGALLAELKSVDLNVKKAVCLISCLHVQTYRALSQLRLYTKL